MQLTWLHTAKSVHFWIKDGASNWRQNKMHR